ncbi:MAG: hypothetical protein ACT4OM_13510 [Actinomycetota bacterium]
MPKHFDAGSMLSQGRARTQRSSTEQPTRLPAPAERTYKSLNIFVTSDQHRWAKNMARTLSDGEADCSMADLFRLAIDQLAEKPAAEIAVEWARHANAEARLFPTRTARKLPPDPDADGSNP